MSCLLGGVGTVIEGPGTAARVTQGKVVVELLRAFGLLYETRGPAQQPFCVPAVT